MTPADQYRVQAGDFAALARAATDPFQKAEYDRLILVYLRLADQADRNSQADLVYEPPFQDEPAQSQAQQQQQPQRDDEKKECGRP